MIGQPDPSLALHLAICTPSYFNNENDEVLRKWNQLQAFGGAGKGTAMPWSDFYFPLTVPCESDPKAYIFHSLEHNFVVQVLERFRSFLSHHSGRRGKLIIM